MKMTHRTDISTFSTILQRTQLELKIDIIITSEKMTASQALIQYKGRDISEKLFRSDKTFIGTKREGILSSQSMSSRIFIEFIALIVRNRIYNLLKDQMIRLESRSKFLTVPDAIRELEKIEMVRRNVGRYKLDHAVTKAQKIILISFGLDETNISKSVEEISTLLAACQSLMNKDVQEDARKRSAELIEAEITKIQSKMTKVQERYNELAEKLEALQEQNRQQQADALMDAYLKSGVPEED